MWFRGKPKRSKKKKLPGDDHWQGKVLGGDPRWSYLSKLKRKRP